jgi:hypothetical protein
MDRSESSHYATVLAAYGELPLWKKVGVIFSLVCLAPVIPYVLGMFAMSVFPLVLLGGFFGHDEPRPAPKAEEIPVTVEPLVVALNQRPAHA